MDQILLTIAFLSLAIFPQVEGKEVFIIFQIKLRDLCYYLYKSIQAIDTSTECRSSPGYERLGCESLGVSALT